METLTRMQFLIYANLVWLAQFVAEFFVKFAPDAVAWEQRVTQNVQVGCVGDTIAYEHGGRLFLLALLWLVSAPLMTVIAVRLPAAWPERVPHFFWNSARRGASLFTLVVALVLLAWPIKAACAVPVTSVILVEVARGLALVVTALYYRSTLIS